MAENKGNPNHDEEGKFTSGSNKASGKKQDYAKQSGFFEEPDWEPLFGLARKIDERSKEIKESDKKNFPQPNSTEDRLSKMGFEGDDGSEKGLEDKISYSEKYPGKVANSYEEAYKLVNEENYTGPGFSAFDNVEPMSDPNDFSEDFDKSFYRFEDDEQKFFENADEKVWDAINLLKFSGKYREKTVEEGIQEVSKRTNINPNDLINAILFSHFYFGSKFKFSPQTNIGKLLDQEDRIYNDYYGIRGN